MRFLFRPFALHAAYTPIETIVFFTIVGTLAYFHILNAIKHSAFLSQNHSPASLRPAHALFHSGEWVPVRESAWASAAADRRATSLELQQLVVTLDSQVRYPNIFSPCINSDTTL